MRMAQASRDVGFELDEAEIESRRGLPIGGPTWPPRRSSAPGNAERLAREQIDDIGALIRGYLIEGRPAFRLRQTPTVAEAVEAIHTAGGVAIWAHPFWDVADPREVIETIDRFSALGIDGVEAFYITHDPRADRAARRPLRRARDCSATGSADFHGPDNKLFSKFMAFDTYGIEPNLGPIAA